MKKELSHETLILNHMISGKTITGMEALREYGCWSLAQRIHRLKTHGHKIDSKFIKLPNGKWVKKYWLIPVILDLIK